MDERDVRRLASIEEFAAAEVRAAPGNNVLLLSGEVDPASIVAVQLAQ